MKKLIYLHFIFMLFIAGQCQNNRPDCHRKINIKNASFDTVIFALKGTNGNEVLLNGEKFPPGKEWEYNAFSDINLSGCWENRISESNNFELYVIDPELHNNPMKYYDSDSIEIKNKVLKKFNLTLQDLQKLDWTIIYP